MIYAITGHTSGIGKCLFQRLYPDVIGFSKSIGYDINFSEDRKKIVKASFHCDVFINNATDNFSQTYMFLDILDAWHSYPNKTIINVGSKIAEIESLPDSHNHLRYYHAEKLSLKKISIYYSSCSKCKILYKWLPYVGTEKILKKYPNFKPNDYISEDQAVNLLLST